MYGLYIKSCEFDEIVRRLFDEGKTTCDELYVVAKKYLEAKVYNSWAKYIRPDPSYEDLEDALQVVCMKIILDAKEKFFLAKNEQGAYKYKWNVGVFCGWMRTKGFNDFIHYFKKLSESFPKYTIVGLDDVDIGVMDDVFTDEDFNERGDVRAAFDELLASNKTSVYSKLTLLAYVVAVVNEGYYGAEKNYFIVETFGKKNLLDMLKDLIKASDKLKWLRLSEEQLQMFITALRKKYDDERIYAEVRYEEVLSSSEGEHIAVSKQISRIVERLKEKLDRK